MRWLLNGAVVLTLVIAPVPAYAQSAAELYALGTAARAELRFGEAIGYLERAVRLQPDNADALVQLGFAYLGAGQPALAEPVFVKVLTLAPDYEDARFGYAQARFRQGDLEGAERLVRLVVAHQPDYREANDLLSQIENSRNAGSGARWRLDFGTEVSSLTGNRGAWSDTIVALSYEFSDEITFGGQARRAVRNGISDEQFTFSANTSLGADWSAYASISVVPDVDFLPQLSLDAGGAWKVLETEGFTSVLSLDAGYSLYSDSRIALLEPAVALGFFDGSLTLTPRLIFSFGDNGTHTSGYAIRADAQILENVSAFIGYFDAPEISGAQTLDVRTIFAGVAVAVTPKFTVRGNVAHEMRASFERTSAGVGTSLRF